MSIITSDKPKTPLLSPIILPSATWRKVAPLNIQLSDIPISQIEAKAITGGKIQIKTQNANHFAKYKAFSLTTNSNLLHIIYPKIDN